MYVNVKDLPYCLQEALARVGYTKKDVALEGREKVCLLDSGSDGRRAFAVLIDLETGERRTTYGSWGGANMFNPTNVVDLDDRAHTLPVGGAVVLGSEGYGGVMARIFLHPENLTKLLPMKVDVSDKDRAILEAIGSLKSGPYRREALQRIRATDEDINSLVARGFLNKNKAGAVSITTEGKNARKS